MKITRLFILGIFLPNLLFAQEARTNSNYAIKFSPTQIVMGEILFGYEQRIAPHSSLELSAGVTISEFGLGRIITNDMNVDFQNNPNQESALGYSVALAYKYYPLAFSEAPRGLYISPEIKYRVYNTLYRMDNFDPIMADFTNKGSFNQGIFRLNIGYQFWPGKTFSLDVFSGIGLSYCQQSYSHNQYIYDDFTGSSYQTFVNNELIRTGVNINFGLKLGIGGIK